MLPPAMNCERSQVTLHWSKKPALSAPPAGGICSASNDKTLKIWDTATGKELHTLAGHTGIVNDCAFNPDGTRIVSASGDFTLKVWDAASGMEGAQPFRTYGLGKQLRGKP